LTCREISGTATGVTEMIAVAPPDTAFGAI